MKKNKIIIPSLFPASIAGAIIYFSVPDNFPAINAGGSSAVSPLMTSLANEYCLSKKMLLNKDEYDIEKSLEKLYKEYCSGNICKINYEK